MRKLNLTNPFTEQVVLTFAVAAVLLFSVWQLASTDVVPETKELQDDVHFLSGELHSIKSRMEQLRERQVVLEQETAIMRKANRLLRENESVHQAELGRLQSHPEYSPGGDHHRTCTNRRRRHPGRPSGNTVLVTSQ